MTPEEQALELGKKAIEEVFGPYKQLVQNLLGPATTQVGLSLGDQLALWRSKRLVRFVRDFYEFASENGLKMNPIPPRLLLSICEHVVLEDDEDLYTRWMALLANAADSDSELEVLPSFPDILKQLTATEARVLDRAYDEVMEDDEKKRQEFRRENPRLDREIFVNSPIHPRTLQSIPPMLIENLERLMLLSRIGHISRTPEESELSNLFVPANHLYLTQFGRTFVRACRLPKRKSSGR